MTLDAALNLIWAAVAATALGLFVVADWRCRRGATLAARARRGLAVLVTLIALFPTVSASDDFARIESMPIGGPAQKAIARHITANGGLNPALCLARLSDAFENSQISRPSWLVATFRPLGFIAEQFPQGCDCSLQSPSCRAPPSDLPISRASI